MAIVQDAKAEAQGQQQREEGEYEDACQQVVDGTFDFFKFKKKTE